MPREPQLVRISMNMTNLGGIHSVEAVANRENNSESIERLWTDMNMVERAAVNTMVVGTLYPILRRGRTHG